MNADSPPTKTVAVALGNLLRRLDKSGGTVMEGHARKCGIWKGDGCNCAIAKRIAEAWEALNAYPPEQPDEPAECKDCDKLMTERDDATEQADQLAACIEGLLGIEIGEHTSGNAPWQNAIDAAEYELDKRRRNAETKVAVPSDACACAEYWPGQPHHPECPTLRQPQNGGAGK